MGRAQAIQSNQAITFDRVTKIFQSRQVALADVSFAWPAGTTVGLLGANGAGKSTAIRIALGLLTASAGDVHVFGKRMHPGAKALRQRTGFLSDDPTFPKDLTAPTSSSGCTPSSSSAGALSPGSRAVSVTPSSAAA